MIRRPTIALFLALFLPGDSVAHPGGVDSNGGHHDRKNGGYHYHGGGGGSGGSAGPSFFVPQSSIGPTGYKYTPPPRKTYAPRPPREPSYAVTHGLKMHTFHDNRGKVLVRGEAERIVGESVIILRANGDNETHRLDSLASVDRAMVLFDQRRKDREAEAAREEPPNTFVPKASVNRWSLDFRTWTSREGVFSVRAKAVAVSAAKVLLRVENSSRVVTVAQERLSDTDREYLADLRAEVDTPIGKPADLPVVAVE